MAVILWSNYYRSQDAIDPIDPRYAYLGDFRPGTPHWRGLKVWHSKAARHVEIFGSFTLW